MKIVVRQPNTEPLEFGLEEGDEVTVGRQPDVNRIVITDIKLSRRHATVRMKDGTFTYTDENSGNGSFIADNRLAGGEAVEIQVGTAVHLGEATLTVEEGAPKVSSTFEADTSKQLGASAVPEGSTGVLIAIDGPLNGKKFGLGDRPLFIGRVPACHIHTPEDKLLSRRNTEINRVSDHYEFKDLGSANGTLLGGDKADHGMLREGDVLTVGESRFRFEFAPADKAPPVPKPKTLDEAATGPAAPASPSPSSPAPQQSSGGGGNSAAMAGVAIVVLILIGTGYYFATRDTPSPDGGLDTGTSGTTQSTPDQNPEAKTFPVRLGRPIVIDMEVTLEKTANVHAARRDVIPFTVGMKVDAVHTANQKRVKAGDPLVTFELTEALKAARTQAESAVTSAKAEIAKAEAEVVKAKRALKNASENLTIAQDAYDKNKALFDAGNLIRSQWDKIRTRRNDAEAQVDIRKQELTQAERTVEQAREKQRQAIAKLDDMQAKIKDLTVTAKTAGVVDGLDLKPGFTVTPQTQSMAIIDYETSVKLVAAIPEDDIAKVRRGMEADVWLSRAPDHKVRGRVTEIPPTARERNYDVEIMVPNKDGHFRPGSQAQVRFIVDTRTDALALPVAVVNTGSDGGYEIFTVDPKRAVAMRIPVQRGTEAMHEGRKIVEVLPDPESTRSLAKDSLVVIDGHRNLRDGATVEITNAADVNLSE